MRAEMQAARRTMLLLIINEAQMIHKRPACNGGAMCIQAKRAHRYTIRRDYCEFSNSLAVTGP
jgi:hypothetical protein